MITRGGTSWLSPNDAIKEVETAKKAGIPILGFEGAFVSAKVTQPSLEDSWDYTDQTYPSVGDPYAHAIEFIQERAQKGLHFEIVVSKPHHR
jgi:hypothetical protein